ncbi:MAG: MFS transporter [Cyanobacteriota bacterium]
MKIFSTLEPQQRKNLFVLFIAGLLFWASLASLLPTLPLYVEDVGGTKQQIGLVMGSFAVGLLLFRPRLGTLADRRSRKLVILIGVGVVAIAPLGYLFASSIPLLMLIRVFHGISIAAYTTGSSVLIVDLSPVEKRGEVIGYMSLTNPIGMALGPALGGFLQEQASYTALFVASFVLGVLSFVLAAQVEEPRLTPVEAPLVDAQSSEFPTDTLSVKPESDKFWQLLGSPRLRIPTLVMLLVGLIFGALATFVALYIREANIDLNAGWFYTAAAMSSFCSRFATGRASDRYGRGLFITIGLVCYILSMLLLSQAQSGVSFLLAGFIEGAGAGTLLPGIIALISDRSYSHERGRVFALCIGGFDVGLAIAGPVFGTFAQQLGYQGIFSLSLGIALLALVVFVTQNSKDVRNSLRFATGRERDIYAL